MEEWKEYKLGEVCDIIPGFAFKSKDFGDDGYLVVKIKDICPPYINLESCQKVNIQNYNINKLSKFILRKGDFSIAMTGATIGKVGRMQSDVLAYINQRVAKFEPHSEFDRDFIYYLVSQNKYRDFVYCHIDSNSAQENISAGSLAEFTFKAPYLPTQRKIASILSSLDDKIELNRRINANLEEQAQALFKSWFIDFEPFKNGKFVDSELGMIPEGWKVGCIGDYCNVRSGYAFKSSWWTEVGEKVVKIKNITNEGNLDMSDCSHVSKENTIKAGQFKVNGGDLLIAMTGATIGKFCIVPNLNEDLFVNQRVGKFFLGEKPIERLPFIYNNLKTQRVYQEIINKGQGSAQPNISGNDIESILIVFPPVNIIECFNKLIQPIYEKILTNTQQSLVLSQTRDTLLPKLMSGEIEIND